MVAVVAAAQPAPHGPPPRSRPRTPLRLVPPPRRTAPDRPPVEQPSRPASARRSLPARRPLPAQVYLRRQLVAGVLVLVVSGLALFGALAALGTLAPQAATAPTSSPEPGAAVHVVQPGENLWSVASDVAGDRNGDLRPVVDELAARAGGSALQPGQRISLEGLGE